MYAAIALASGPFGGVTTATARLPSAVAAALTLLMVFVSFAGRLGRGAGLVAAAVLPASFLWLGRVPSAEIDRVQLAWVTGSLFALLRAVEAAEGPAVGGGRLREWLWWQAALACVAAGVLTKWTAPAFFYLSAVPFLWWRGRLRLLGRWPHLTAAALAAIPCLGWALAAARLAGWDTFRETVLREALERLWPADHPRPYPWAEVLTFPLAFLAASLPWSLLALPSLRPSFWRLWDERGRRLLGLCHCWLWPNLFFWALVPGHKARHLLPAQPALAGLAAFVWVAWLSGRLPWPLRRPRPAVVLCALLALWWA
jgi:4-amino-4-deoxy-L-arabinose transferase-like glycosyltransferase